MAERVRSLLFALKATLDRLGQQQGGGGGGGGGEHALKGDVVALVAQLLKRAERTLTDRGEIGLACWIGGAGIACMYVPYQPFYPQPRTHSHAEVPRDEKLLCASLLLRSDEPPDLLRFLAWGAGMDLGPGFDGLKRAKKEALDTLYDLVKVSDEMMGV